MGTRSRWHERKQRGRIFGLAHTRRVVELITVRQEIHAKRIESLSNALAGTVKAASAAVNAIGVAYSSLAKTSAKHGIKQVDRLLSNSGIDDTKLQEGWIRYVLGDVKSVLIALDWTDFSADDHATLFAAMITTKGRTVPLAWKTVKKSELKGRQNQLEEALIESLHRAVPKDVRLTLLADRGFGRMELYKTLEFYGWDYVIRFRSDILVECGGETRFAGEFLHKNGRARALDEPKMTAEGIPIPRVVLVKAKAMAEPWCLATSLRGESASDIVRFYGRRFTIEEMFRDAKDIHFGMGLRARHIKDAARRDRLLFLVAVAHSLLTLLGMASERSGLDRQLKANTVKTRTHSLFRQGCIWYEWLPDLDAPRLKKLLGAYEQILKETPFLGDLFALQGPSK